MKQPASMVLRSYLGFKGHVTVPKERQTWPAFVSHMPEQSATVPMDATCLVDTTGITQGKLRNTLTVVERYAVQLQVRSTDYRQGWRKLWDITRELDAVLRLGIDAGNYLYAIPNIVRSAPIALGQEPNVAKRRYLATLNVHFSCDEEGPYPEWGNSNEELYGAIYNLHQLVHVDMPLYFGTE